MAKTEPHPHTESEKPKAASVIPWSPLMAVFMVVAAYLGASIVGQIVLAIYGNFRHWSDRELERWLTDSTYAQFASSLLIYGLMALTIYVFARGYKVSLKVFGLVQPRLKDLGIALLGVPVYILGYVTLLGAAQVLFPKLDVNQEQQLGFQPSHSVLPLVLTFFSLVILPPLVEELLMRGFLFTSLLKRYKFVVATLITSAIFATAHLQIGSGAPLLWVAAIDTFMLSLVLCFMRYKTGSLWPGIFLHALKNGIAFVSIFILHII